MGPAETVRVLVEPILVADGTEVIDVEYSGGRLLVTVDRDGGIDLEALTKATRTVSSLLDEHDPIPGGHYLLEVSSPGLERTLRTPEHFARALGQTINVKTHAHAGSGQTDSDRRIEGELTQADGEGIVVAGRHLHYDDIERARTVFAWGPTPKPTGGPPKKPHPHTAPTQSAKADAS